MIKIIKVRGGIGNQMFCFAFYYALSKRYKLSYVEMDIYSNHCDRNGFVLHKIFDHIKIKPWNFYRRLHKIYNVFFTRKLFRAINEISSGTYQTLSFPLNPFVVYIGFWQSEMYFESYQKQLRNIFSFNQEKLNNYSQKLLAQINATDSISVHIRRGDYLDHGLIYGNICTEDYYKKAISYITDSVENPFFFFFSDDTKWVKENFKTNNSFFVDFNSGTDSWQDMFLMSNCKHNIIANSTFSWWGAWLNRNNSKIVIAPNKWMNNLVCKDIIPKSWIRI